MDFLRNENLWLYVPLIIWISGIFYLSSNKGSTSSTSRYLNPVLHFLFPRANEANLKTYHLIFRKLCHFCGYGILAVLASMAFYYSTAIFLAKFWYLFAFLIVFLIASLDEIKQSFYPERDGSFSDVVLDSFGGLIAISLFRLLIAF